MTRRVTKAVNEHRARNELDLAGLYERDETAWLEQMALLIKDGRYPQLDYVNLGEYLLDMAKRDRREVENRLATLLTHLLKWEHQPRKRTRSWEATIVTQQDELQGLLDSKTLKNHAEAALPKAYKMAVRRAAKETGLSEDAFPAECPYGLDEALSWE